MTPVMRMQSLVSFLKAKWRRERSNALVVEPTARRQSDDQLRYLSHATFLEEAGTSRFMNYTGLAASVCVGGFIIWAGMTDISEVSHAPGEVVPSGLEQVVQHLDGGIVKKINVQVGDMIEKDQIVLTVDDGSTNETLERTKARRIHLETAAVRLRALIDASVPDFSKIKGMTPDEVLAQRRLFEGTLEEQLGRERVIQEQIEQAKSTGDIHSNQLETVKKSLVLAQRLLEARRDLFDKKLLAYPILAKAEQDVIQLEGELKRANEQLKQNQATITEFTERLNAVRLTSRLDVANKLNEASSEIKQVASAIDLLERRQERLELRAPVRGLVKSLQVNSIGAILSAGQTVLTIVPVDDELVVEAQIPARDIGHIRKGQQVHVKVSAFDFSRYGVVKGTLDRVSAATFVGKTGEHHYRARIRLAQAHVGANPGHNRMMPGMTVMADIETGKKTILDYLLKPVKAAAATAFSER